MPGCGCPGRRIFRGTIWACAWPSGSRLPLAPPGQFIPHCAWRSLNPCHVEPHVFFLPANCQTPPALPRPSFSPPFHPKQAIGHESPRCTVSTMQPLLAFRSALTSAAGWGIHSLGHWQPHILGGAAEGCPGLLLLLSGLPWKGQLHAKPAIYVPDRRGGGWFLR